MTLDELANLPADWNGADPAPVPNAAAIAAARACLAELSSLGVAYEVDADVMGGVGIYLHAAPPSPHYVWLAFGNDGINTVIFGGGDTGLPQGEWLSDAAALRNAIAWVNPDPTPAVPRP